MTTYIYNAEGIDITGPVLNELPGRVAPDLFWERVRKAEYAGHEACQLCGRPVSGKGWNVMPTGMGVLLRTADWEQVRYEDLLDNLGVQFIGQDCAQGIPVEYKRKGF